jgi:hypothetical protein
MLTSGAVVALGLAALTAGTARADDALNRKVVRFALDHLGKKVGDGECWTLADEALAAAGARRPGTGGYGFDVFGRAVEQRALAPGDVIQFDKAFFQSRDGSWNTFGQHTAVVAAVKGTRVTLLHQNYGNKRTVERLTLDLADLQRGALHCYRPEPR